MKQVHWNLSDLNPPKPQTPIDANPNLDPDPDPGPGPGPGPNSNPNPNPNPNPNQERIALADLLVTVAADLAKYEQP